MERLLFCSLFLCISFLSISANNFSTKFNIVLKTPNNTVSPTELSHKAVHVKYTLPNDHEQWNIVGFEPIIQVHRKAVEQLTVHLCDTIIYRSIWYDDHSVCDNSQSMLIYEWTSYSSLSAFRLSDDTGFEFSKSKSIILTVIYRKEKRAHKEQSGIILYISTQSTRFQMGTILIGNKERGRHFSCRSSTLPRLFYAVKKLSSEKNQDWWRIYTIRTRPFGRKIIQAVLNFENLFNQTKNNIEMISSELFFISGDYLLIECGNNSQSNCYFLLYFMYKSKETDNDKICQYNEHPDLLKLLPSREVNRKNEIAQKTSKTDGSTIFLILGILLFFIWISIIIGCIIMRRIRGLVNFRTEPSSSSSAQKNKLLAYGGRGPHEHYNPRTGDADNAMQIDVEHAGLMS